MTICKERTFPDLSPLFRMVLAATCAALLTLLPVLRGWQVPPMLLGGMNIASAALPVLPNYALAAHAMGQIDDYTGTNSLEAFQANYEKGYRTFECDFAMTSDGYVVLRHDWSDGIQAGISSENIPDRETFLNTPIHGQYTPLSFGDLLSLMDTYSDILIITDSKDTTPTGVTQMFTAMMREARSAGKMHLLDRMVVQLYSPEMQKAVEKVRHFERYMLTLYQTSFYGEPDLFIRYLAECQKQGIQDVVMWHFLHTADIQAAANRYGIRLWLHTVNDIGQARSYLDQGAWGIYSDRLDPDDLRRVS